MSEKQFRLPADQIKPLVQGLGGCYATEMITVQGHKVGYMYREEQDFHAGSGWRFLAGVESQQYLANPDNLAIYDVNTIANYDPEIIPLLNAPVGSAFERNARSGKLVEVKSK
jgi:hypothetical protein